MDIWQFFQGTLATMNKTSYKLSIPTIMKYIITNLRYKALIKQLQNFLERFLCLPTSVLEPLEV